MGTDTQNGQGQTGLSAQQVLRPLASLVIMVGAPFLAAGRLDWWAAWALIAVTLALSAVSRIIPARRNPDLLAERARFAEVEGVKSWDRVLMPLMALVIPLLTWVVAGLNVRFGWLPAVSPAVQALGFLLVLAGGILATWAMVENRFFSAVVRIQQERGHEVISSGPYRLVRHPAYAGGLAAGIGTGLALGSVWALIPGALMAALTVVRTALEDRTLRAELPGYEDYTRRTRHRLLPGIW